MPPPTSAVLKQLQASGNSSAAGDLRLGQGLLNVGKSVAKGMPSVGRGAANVAGAVLAPAGIIGPPILGAAHAAGKAVLGSPGATKALIAAGLLGPTLLASASDNASKHTQEMLNSGDQMKLSNHRIKTSGFGGLAQDALVSHIPHLFEGAAKGIGTGVVDGLFSAGASLGGMAMDSTVNAYRRKQVFAEALKTDPILMDAVKSNPQVMKNMQEAFATLVRFAPSLSLDINAVRSYLREAVISGGGINYATIKQLADTEKVVHDRNTRRK